MAVSSIGSGQDYTRPDRLLRHRLADRLFHWIMAVSVLVLVVTAFLPILGFKFNWVPTHWITGLVLTVVTLFHIVRASIWQSLGSIVPGPRDVVDGWRIVRRALVDRAAPPVRQGKYSVAQKLYHLGITVLVLLIIATGLLMLAKIDTELWQRNPYFLSSYSWGLIYVIHGYASMALLSGLIIHVYFALRPEKLFFTRSMIVGWITRREYRDTFDPARWSAEQEEPAAETVPARSQEPAE
ncbi:MAG: cytochrome b/b6 domain-containing protein [Hyphomicrobiales bacterium]|nr:cytochrome b/b6 domain-containing protein [Hyphomicrobiales bacterium]